jgi:hypothetical protein
VAKQLSGFESRSPKHTKWGTKETEWPAHSRLPKIYTKKNKKLPIREFLCELDFFSKCIKKQLPFRNVRSKIGQRIYLELKLLVPKYDDDFFVRSSSLLYLCLANLPQIR